MLIVIVEDDHDIATLWSLGLQESADVLIAHSYQEAMELPWRNVDGAIIDLVLGGPGDGADLLRWLDENHPTVKKVLVTAVPPWILKDRGIPTEKYTILEKPSSLSEIQLQLGVLGE